jgi:hypothetical protein
VYTIGDLMFPDGTASREVSVVAQTLSSEDLALVLRAWSPNSRYKAEELATSLCNKPRLSLLLKEVTELGTGRKGYFTPYFSFRKAIDGSEQSGGE